MFPFGHGLSYTTFEYDDLVVAPEEVVTAAPEGEVTVTCSVANSGRRAGDEVVQLYLQDPYASVTRPVLELRGFQRVTLAPNQTKSLTFKLSREDVGFYDNHERFRVENGLIEVYAGGSSSQADNKGTFRVVNGDGKR